MSPPPSTAVLRLPFHPPLHPDNLFGHLVATAVPGVEEWRDGRYRRTLRLPHGPAIVAAAPPGPGDDHLDVRVWVSHPDDVAAAAATCRHLLDLDVEPARVDAGLSADPVLRPLVDAAPGRRVPRAVDGDEMAVRALLGQQVSTAAARTHAARLVLTVDERVDDPDGGLTHLFPTALALTRVPADALALPAARRRGFATLVRALADGEVDLRPGADVARARADLLALAGIGPWTVETIAMRALADLDAFLPTDLGVRQAAERLGLPTTPAALAARAERWRPHRAYAVQHLWATGDHPVNRLPAATDGAGPAPAGPRPT